MTTFNFNPSATGYDSVNAYSLGLAAQLAYSESPEVRKQTTDWGFDQFQFFDNKGTQAFLIANASLAILAFRGTQPTKIRDILADTRLGLKNFPDGKGQVHEGFFSALEFVWPEVLAQLPGFLSKGQSLWITGHSLGAALATLATARLRLGSTPKPVTGLYTFGQPRVGNRSFAQAFDQDFKPRAFRFVNNNDVVTQVPVPGIFLKYSHTGTLLYFDKDGNLQTDIGWWQQFLDGAQGRLSELGKLGSDGLKDHFMDNYLKCLSKNIPRNP